MIENPIHKSVSFTSSFKQKNVVMLFLSWDFVVFWCLADFYLQDITSPWLVMHFRSTGCPWPFCLISFDRPWHWGSAICTGTTRKINFGVTGGPSFHSIQRGHGTGAVPFLLAHQEN